jgi:hypothetical protein
VSDPDEVTAEDCMWIVVELMLMLLLGVADASRGRGRERDGDRCMRCDLSLCLTSKNEKDARNLFSTCRS